MMNMSTLHLFGIVMYLVDNINAVAEWIRALAWTGDRCANPAAATSLRNVGNSVYPALPVSFGGDTKGHATRNDIVDDGF